MSYKITRNVTAIVERIPLNAPTKNNPNAVEPSMYLKVIGSTVTVTMFIEALDRRSAINRSLHVSMVILSTGVGHFLLSGKESSPTTIILGASSASNHDSSMLISVLAVTVPSKFEYTISVLK